MVMMAGEKKLHYPHFYGGSRGDADFYCPIITGLRENCGKSPFKTDFYA
jgi:hypothetical protein